jgi:hypothetical protein
VPESRIDRLSSSSTYTHIRFYFDDTRFGRSQLSSLGQLTHTRRTDGTPESDGALRTVTRAKIRHYRQLYINLPEPIAFMSVAVDTAGRMRYQRNRNNLDFFTQLALLILRGQWG